MLMNTWNQPTILMNCNLLERWTLGKKLNFLVFAAGGVWLMPSRILNLIMGVQHTQRHTHIHTEAGEQSISIFFSKSSNVFFIFRVKTGQTLSGSLRFWTAEGKMWVICLQIRKPPDFNHLQEDRTSPVLHSYAFGHVYQRRRKCQQAVSDEY